MEATGSMKEPTGARMGQLPIVTGGRPGQSEGQDLHIGRPRRRSRPQFSLGRRGTAPLTIKMLISPFNDLSIYPPLFPIVED